MEDRISKFNYLMIDELRGKINANSYVEVLSKLYLLGYIKQLNTIEEIAEIHPHQNSREYLELLFDKISSELPMLSQALYDLNAEKSLSEPTLERLLKSILDVPFDKVDWKNAIEDLLSTSDGGNTGIIQTPQCLNELGIKLLNLRDGSFYDGTAGVNGTAIAAFKYAHEIGSTISLHTQEIAPSLAAVGSIRAFMHGITDIQTAVGDTIANPTFTDGTQLKKFDYIMMDFPFGMAWQYKENELIYDKYSRFIYGKPTKSSSEWLFVSHIIKSLKVTGKAIVMLSAGSLFNTGTEAIREKIIKEDLIEAVIALPAGLFSHTAIPVNMLILNREKEKKGKILFVNAEDMAITASRSKKEISSENITKIADIYKRSLEVDEISKLVNLEELHKNMLIPNKYVSKAEIETEKFGKVKIKPDEIKKLDTLERLGALGKFYRGINTSSCTENPGNGKYNIINLADVQVGELILDSVTRYDINRNAKIDEYTVRPGDIIVSCKGTATKICIIPDHTGQMLISQNFIGIRLSERQSPKFIKEFLESPLGKYLIANKQLGSTITMLNVKDLQEVPVLSIPLKEQETMVKRYEELVKSIKSEILRLEQEAKEAQLNLYKQMGIEKTFKLMGEKNNG